MRKFILAAVILFSSLGFSQIIVNNEDIKNKTSMFEVWAYKKPFSQKECYFIDYGQSDFNPVLCDYKTQSISDSNSLKFEKGEWIKLIQYIESQGFEKNAERTQAIGSGIARVITFKKKV